MLILQIVLGVAVLFILALGLYAWDCENEIKLLRLCVPRLKADTQRLTSLVMETDVENHRLRIAAGETSSDIPTDLPGERNIYRDLAMEGISTHHCPRVNARQACEPCGYPFSEAMGDDDTTPHRGPPEPNVQYSPTPFDDLDGPQSDDEQISQAVMDSKAYIASLESRS